jgi:hypothetical protein
MLARLACRSEIALSIPAKQEKLAAAGIGWFGRRHWGWRLAVAIIATQIFGDVINCVRGDWLPGGIGVVIAGALLLFFLRPTVKKAFA